MKSKPTDPKIELVRQIRGVMVETGFKNKWTALAATLNERGINPLEAGAWNKNSLRNFCITEPVFAELKGLLPPGTTPIVRHRATASHKEPAPQVSHTEVQSNTETYAQDTVLHSQTPDLDSPVQHSEGQCGTPDSVSGAEGDLSDSAIHSGTPEGLQHTEGQSLTRPGVTHEEHSVLQTGETDSAQHSVLHSRTRGAVTQEQHSVTQLPPEVVSELLQMLKWWKNREGEDMPVITQQARPKFKRGANTVTKTIRLSAEMVDAVEKLVRKHAWTGGSFNALVEFLLWQALGSKPKFVEPETD